MRTPLIILCTLLVLAIGGCVGCSLHESAEMQRIGDELKPVVSDLVSRWNERDLGGIYDRINGRVLYDDAADYRRKVGAVIDRAGPITDWRQAGLSVRTDGAMRAQATYHYLTAMGNGRLIITFRKGTSWSVVGWNIEFQPSDAKLAR